MDTLSGRRGKRTQLGAAAVEFALILPVMMLVIGGIVDFGRAYFTQIQLTNAAREGARAAIVGGDGVARATAAAGGLTNFSAIVPPPPCTPNTDVTATTQVTKFQWIVLGPIMGMFPGGSGALPTTLESTAVMRCT